MQCVCLRVFACVCVCFVCRVFAMLAGARSDRTSAIGQMINGYLQNTQDMSDEAIHLLFSANRWEAKCVAS